MPPPEGSRFGRVQDEGYEAGCTNPAALGGGRAALHAYLRQAVLNRVREELRRKVVDDLLGLHQGRDPGLVGGTMVFQGVATAGGAIPGMLAYGTFTKDSSVSPKAPRPEPRMTPIWGASICAANSRVGARIKV